METKRTRSDWSDKSFNEKILLAYEQGEGLYEYMLDELDQLKIGYAHLVDVSKSPNDHRKEIVRLSDLSSEELATEMVTYGERRKGLKILDRRNS
jgi:hypothetical protein